MKTSRLALLCVACVYTRVRPSGESRGRNPTLDSELQPRRFAAGEKQALIAFLRSLSGRIQEGM